MNDIYSKIISYCPLQKKEILVKNEEYKEVIFESEHPYVPGSYKFYILDIPGQKGPLYLEFDEKCQLCSPDDTSKANAIYFYKDEKKNTTLFSRYNKN
jgi:hypothetical protein